MLTTLDFIRRVVPALAILFAVTGARLQTDFDRIVGYWEGEFMPGNNLTLVLHFSRGETLKPMGRVLLFQGTAQIQDDPLSKILLKEKQLTFFIEAKSTPFEGEVDANLGQIRGHFRFPDGSLQPVLLQKVDKPSVRHPLDAPKDVHAKYSVEQLQEDVRFLREKLGNTHPQLYLYSSKSELDHSFQEIVTHIKTEMREDAFFRLLAPAVARVKCSHTGIRFSEAFLKSLEEVPVLLPIKIRVFGENAYIIDNYCDAEIRPGTEILAINGVSVPEILKQMMVSLPADGGNLSAKRFAINQDFASMYAHYIELSDHFRLELLAQDDKHVFLELPAATLKELTDRSTTSRGGQADALPAHFEILENSSIGVLTVSAFMARDWQRFLQLFESSFNTLKTQKTQNLILDVRGAMGGHPFIASELFSYLVHSDYVYFAKPEERGELAPLYELQEPKPNRFEGNLYVLMNGGCLSTTGHFLSLVKYHELGTLVGEAAGGSFYCNDNSIQLTLPNTGMRVNIPQTTFETAVRGFKKGAPLLPDYEVKPTLQDILNQFDAEMAFVQNLIKTRKSNKL
ncbi:hypothetical protein GWO43_02605 [candidate division KSB1 bacterium]|nr:hypothetical protein [candidate division KSB1 bacterium]NIR69762.1 hypothetical protein [candidate division KSB1 bacterium]NIS22945.1 hypothetical protein [candidate division KSB1 bacterium]NIT69802.1 hypothetical protein [candidate division KSB1 bacterium]NIU23476.1 hypothetical protein [candidate division KSB1 bacterium]